MLQPARGTHDLIFDQAKKHEFVIQTARHLSSLYGFSEIHTPIFEFTSVFSKTLGDVSDIVTKEMYTFTDKGGDSITLRPEGTAGVVRAFLSNELKRELPLRFFYQGPMFRYERPQKGRFRQFHQIGVELLGVESTQSDIEVLSLAKHTLASLDILQLCELEINSIGDKESRNTYRQKLVEYFKKYESDLSEDSQKRLNLNPMRILDSKDKKDIEIAAQAPLFENSLNSASKTKFDDIQKKLSSLNINYKLNPKLVRGLDYYSHLVFEFKTQALGAQDAVLSGGRYDSLVEMMGGDPTPGVGWAAGVERLCLLTQKTKEQKRPLALIPIGETAENYCLSLAHQLRGLEIPIEMAYSGNLSNRMKKAVRVNCSHALIVGESELSQNKVAIKTLDTGDSITIEQNQIETHLNAIFKTNR